MSILVSLSSTLSESSWISVICFTRNNSERCSSGISKCVALQSFISEIKSKRPYGTSERTKSNRGARAPPKKVLERSATFDSFVYILGQLTRSPTTLKDDFWFTPSIEQSRLPRGQTMRRISASWSTFSKIGRNNFEGTFAGNGKMRILSCADETPRLNFSESVHVCVFVLLWANTLIFKRPVY